MVFEDSDEDHNCLSGITINARTCHSQHKCCINLPAPPALISGKLQIAFYDGHRLQATPPAR